MEICNGQLCRFNLPFVLLENSICFLIQTACQVESYSQLFRVLYLKFFQYQKTGIIIAFTVACLSHVKADLKVLWPFLFAN